MKNNYIVFDKSKIKRNIFIIFIIAVIVCGFIWVYISKPFLGFGYHNFTEQLFRLLLGIFVPIIIMTATDYLMIMLFNKDRFAYIANFIEMLLISGKYCYSSLCSSDGELLGFTSPNIVITLSAVFHLLFWLILFFVQVFILHKLVLRSIVK